MIKGWRYDPRWVAIYAEREKKRAEAAYRFSYAKLEGDRVRESLNLRIAKAKYPKAWGA